jgi:hypothetical protein
MKMHIFFNLCYTFLHSMLKNTQNYRKTLAILQIANKDMLHASGNPVSSRLKAELDHLK